MSLKHGSLKDTYTFTSLANGAIHLYILQSPPPTHPPICPSIHQLTHFAPSINQSTHPYIRYTLHFL